MKKYIILFILLFFAVSYVGYAKSIGEVVNSNHGVNYKCKYEIVGGYKDNSTSSAQTIAQFKLIFGFKAIEFELSDVVSSGNSVGKLFDVELSYSNGGTINNPIYYKSPANTYEKNALKTLRDWTGINGDYSGWTLNINQSNFVEQFTNQYKTSSVCPTTIYMQAPSNAGTNYHISLYPLQDYLSYQLNYVGNNQSSGQTQPQNNCRHQNAITCEKVSAQDGKYHFELGWYDASGISKKYFLTSKSSNLNDFVSDDIEGDDYSGLFIDYDSSYFYIEPKAISEIYQKNNKVLSKSKIVVTISTVTRYDHIYEYYISGPNSKYEGGFDQVQDNNSSSFIPNHSSPQYTSKINYNSLCSNKNIKQTMKIVGYLVQVARWIVPLIIIVFGMIDFGKASIESDEKTLNKATASLIRRIVAGVVIFFIPTIILGLLNAIEITKGIEDESNSQFGACTKCIFGAHKAGYCDIPSE